MGQSWIAGLDTAVLYSTYDSTINAYTDVNVNIDLGRRWRLCMRVVRARVDSSRLG
jgi:hypothetical protein